VGAALIAVLAVTLTAPTSAAETEPHYGWQHPPADGTASLNTAIRALLERGLHDVNAAQDARDRRCADVALAVVQPLQATAGWFFVGLTRSWPVAVRPATSTEYVEEFLPASTYRDLHLLPFGQFVPHDPVVRVGDVVFGTDKIGHLFTNGARAFARFTAARERGVKSDVAERFALVPGIDEEHTLLGVWASGIFSFADLEANAAGLRYLRSLCEGPAPGLRVVDDHWQLAPFDIAAWVTPCFDEAFEPSAFSACDDEPMQAAIRTLCPRWRRRDVQERWARYRQIGCTNSWRPLLATLRAEGRVPDARRWDISRICDDDAADDNNDDDDDDDGPGATTLRRSGGDRLR
jgi:hypothetical protein